MKKVLPILLFSLVATLSFSQTCATCNAAFGTNPDGTTPGCNEILPGVVVCEAVLTGGPDAGNTIQCNYNAAGCVSAVFPVELTSFNVILDGNSIQVIWETVSEENNEMFIVQRSYNGIDFESIYEVTGSGTTTETKNYNVEDKGVNLLAEANFVYYRLMQIDYDGSFSFSETVSVKLDSKGGFVINNIVAQEADVSVYYLAEKEGTVDVSIFDMSGRVIGKLVNNTSEGYNSVTIPVEFAAKGMYFVNITDGQTILTQKFIH